MKICQPLEIIIELVVIFHWPILIENHKVTKGTLKGNPVGPAVVSTMHVDFKGAAPLITPNPIFPHYFMCLAVASLTNIILKKQTNIILFIIF